MPTPTSSDPSFQHGYYTGAAYTYGVYAEYFPTNLALITQLFGHRPPRMEAPFRLVELGCGQGLGLCVQAALHPHAEFTGIDLMPAHIGHGRALAAAASLTNVRFVEGDFLQLASHDARPHDGSAPGTDGGADIVVAHGVLSWVNHEVQQALWTLAATSLRPGGLFAVSYNSHPGQLAQVPFQHLVQSLQHSMPSGPACLQEAISTMRRLQSKRAGVFGALPVLPTLLDELPLHNPQYLPHEYNQQFWQPLFSDQVIRSAAGHGFSFLGSATPHYCFPGLLPSDFQELLREESDPAQRELLRDLMLNTSFRRDVYVRGPDYLWPQEAEEALLEQPILRLIDEAKLRRSDPRELFTFPLSFGTLQGNVAWFGAFLEALGPQPRRLRELTQLEGTPPITLPELMQNLALLLRNGLVTLVAPPVPPEASQRLNRVLVRKVLAGAPYRVLAAPLIGSTMHVNDIECFCLAALEEGFDGPALVAAVDAAMHRLGREVRHEGRSLSGGERQELLEHHVARFEQRTLPQLRRLGAVA